MKLPFKYVINNFKSRKITTAITVAGIAMVVFVFAAVLMMAYGIEKTLAATGAEDNVMILRKAASGEISSIISGETGNIIQSLPNIFLNADGRPVVSKEPVVVINLKIEGGGFSNITVRGVSLQIQDLRPQVTIVEGKMFNPALRELIVGTSIAKRFPEAQLNQTIKFAGNDWTVVGIFSTDGSGFDSEIWGDAVQMLDAFNRGSSVSTITIKLDDPAGFEQFKLGYNVQNKPWPRYSFWYIWVTLALGIILLPVQI